MILSRSFLFWFILTGSIKIFFEIFSELILSSKKNYIIVDDGKQEFEFQLDYIGKNKIEASKSSYKGFFKSKLVGSSSLTINTISGVGKFESYYDYKSGVPKGYNFLDYINCRFF